MRTLVTGGAGFIGSSLVDSWLERGWWVTVLDNFDPYYDPAQKRRNLMRAASCPRYRLIEADVRDPSALASACEEARPDVVVHLAACAGVQPSVREPSRYLLTNELGALHVLEACRARGNVPLVFASTSSVYGTSESIPFRETEPAVRPLSPYAATKRSAELMVHAYHHLYRLPVVVLRLFTVYGPRGRPDMAVWLFTEALLRRRPVVLRGADTQRDFTYIDDIVRGLTAATEWLLEGRGYDTFNLGRGEPILVRALVELLARELRVEPRIEVGELAPAECRVTMADVSRARQAFGYEPRVGIEQGVVEWIRWLRDSPEAPPELRP